MQNEPSKKVLEDTASCSSKCKVRTVTHLIAITDKVLRESGIFSVQDAQAQTKQAEIFNGFLDRPEPPNAPGTFLSVHSLKG